MLLTYKQSPVYEQKEYLSQTSETDKKEQKELSFLKSDSSKPPTAVPDVDSDIPTLSPQKTRKSTRVIKRPNYFQ